MNTSKRIVYIPTDADKARANEYSTLKEATNYAKRYGYSHVVASLVETTVTNLYTHDIKKAEKE